MDKDRIKGSAQQGKGVVKQVIGKITGDDKLEAQGESEKVAGRIQNAAGGIKDTLRGKWLGKTESIQKMSVNLRHSTPTRSS